MTPAAHQKQPVTEANTALNRQAMTLDQWRERVNACHHIDDPVVFREEKRFLDAVGQEKGFLSQGLTTKWSDYFYVLVGQLLRGRDPLKSLDGRVILTIEDVLQKASEDTDRLWSAYRYAVDGRPGSAASDLNQAMRMAAMNLVELYKDDLDIEGRTQQRGAA